LTIDIATPTDLSARLQGSRQKPGKSLLDSLTENNLLSTDELKKLRGSHRRDGVDYGQLGKFLTQHGRMDDREYAQLLADSLGIPTVNLRNFEFDPRVVEVVPFELAKEFRVMPMVLEKEHLVVAMSNPADRQAIEMLGFLTKKLVDTVAASASDIDYAIGRFYDAGVGHDFLADLKILEDEVPGEEKSSDEHNLGQERPTVRLVQHIILDAIVSRASDIHIQPRDGYVELLFRVDGQLLGIRKFSKALLGPIVSRIKIISGGNIAERRLPQDGRARVRYRGEEVDLRVSVMPTIHGESVVIRILDRSVSLRSLAQVGFNDRDEKAFSNLMHKSHGLILVTGPTGCGKSTTLYAALQEIIGDGKNIITVEDPVEYHVEGLTQIQVRPNIGYNFARALRHILRHDPDVIMVGEIRDLETARMAVESSLTGHIVLSTLHTNSAVSTVTRLLEMGIEPYLVNTSLLAVLAQRLIRTNCESCVAEEVVSSSMRQEMGLEAGEVFYRGAGCEHCLGTGYHGRRVVYELLPIEPEIRELIKPGVSVAELENLALARGMVPLGEVALSLARAHITSLEEAYRVRLN
jgi:type IV pilus assembly protein PilB